MRSSSTSRPRRRLPRRPPFEIARRPRRRRRDDRAPRAAWPPLQLPRDGRAGRSRCTRRRAAPRPRRRALGALFCLADDGMTPLRAASPGRRPRPRTTARGPPRSTRPGHSRLGVEPRARCALVEAPRSAARRARRSRAATASPRARSPRAPASSSSPRAARAAATTRARRRSARRPAVNVALWRAPLARVEPPLDDAGARRPRRRVRSTRPSPRCARAARPRTRRRRHRGSRRRRSRAGRVAPTCRARRATRARRGAPARRGRPHPGRASRAHAFRGSAKRPLVSRPRRAACSHAWTCGSSATATVLQGARRSSGARREVAARRRARSFRRDTPRGVASAGATRARSATSRPRAPPRAGCRRPRAAGRASRVGATERARSSSSARGGRVARASARGARR